MWPHRRLPIRLPCPWDSPGKNTGVGYHFLLQCMKLKSEREVAQSCPTPQSHGLQPTRLLHPWDFPGKSTGVRCHRLLCLFIIGDWNAKVGSQETPRVTGKFGLGVLNEAGQRLMEFCQENALDIANTLFQQHKRKLYTSTSPRVNTKIRLIIFFATKDGEAIYSQQKQDRELTEAQIMNSLLPNSD